MAHNTPQVRPVTTAIPIALASSARPFRPRDVLASMEVVPWTVPFGGRAPNGAENGGSSQLVTYGLPHTSLGAHEVDV